MNLIPETTNKSYFIVSNGGGWGRGVGVASRLRKYICSSMLAFLCTNPPGHFRYHSNNTDLRLLLPRTSHIGVENHFYDFPVFTASHLLGWTRNVDSTMNTLTAPDCPPVRPKWGPPPFGSLFLVFRMSFCHDVMTTSILPALIYPHKAMLLASKLFPVRSSSQKILENIYVIPVGRTFL